MKGIPKTPVEFDYDLWTTEDGKCMVRIKATGEVTEVERTVMQVLRSEEKRFRRAMSLDQEADRDGISKPTILKRKNTAAREISRSIADLNAKLVMVEQLHAKGYLKDEVHKAQVQDINDQLRQLKRERQCEFSSGITDIIEEVTRLKKLLEELEEPLDRFDEKLFAEIVQAIRITRRDEMTVTLIGGLRFTEML